MKQEVVQLLERPNYTFRTDTLTFVVAKSKNGKKVYVTGYISTGEIDLYNDLVTPSAMKSMLRQIMESTITIDYDHEAFRENETILPVGKIVTAKVDENGLWVKAELNKYSPKFKDLWGSIKEGFVNAFSIAFQPLKTVEKEIGDVKVRLIEDLKLLNVALTGIPVNKGAVLTDYGMKAVMLKAIQESEQIGEQVVVPKQLLTKLTEVKNMEEAEQKQEAEAPEEPKAEEAKPEEEVPKAEEEASEEAPAEEKPVEAKSEEEPKEEAKEESKEEPKEESVEEPKAEEPAEAKEDSVEQKALATIVEDLKANVAKLEEENSGLKADLKSLKESKVFKSPTPVKAVEQKSKPRNMISYI